MVFLRWLSRGCWYQGLYSENNRFGQYWLLISDSYRHKRSLQSFSQKYDLASFTTYIVYIHFIHERWDLQFKTDSERHIFENLFKPNLYFYSQSLARNLLRGSRWRNIFFRFFKVTEPGLLVPRSLFREQQIWTILSEFLKENCCSRYLSYPGDY